MASVDIGRHETYRDRRRRDEREYRAIILLILPVFLAMALTRRLAGLATGRRAARARPSVLAEARSTAASAIPFAFR